jgi:hypothetical protein
MKVFTAKDLVKKNFNPALIGDHNYCENSGYRFVLKAPLTIAINRHLGRHQFADENGHVWLSIEGQFIMVSEGYATDGCSPKFKLGPAWVGTPDFLWTRLASTIHDAFYQFAHIPCCPLTRHEADHLFYDLMIMDIKRLKTKNPTWARIIAGGYRNAVMSAGVPFYHLGSLTKGRHGSCLNHKILTA